MKLYYLPRFKRLKKEFKHKGNVFIIFHFFYEEVMFCAFFFPAIALSGIARDVGYHVNFGVNYKDVFISVIKVRDLYIQIIDNSNKTLSLSPFFIFNKETNTCLIFRDNYNAGLMKHFLLQHEGSKGLESNINIIYI